VSFQHPALLAVALVVGAALVAAYRWLHAQRTAALARAGLRAPGRNVRRHVPVALFIAALVLLMLGLARPEATVAVPRLSGTVVLAFDVSNSMTAKDVAPTRLDAAKSAARSFVAAQPSTVDIGLVAFGGAGALTTQQPSDDHAAALAAIDRLATGGGTSLGNAILAALGAVVGKPVSLPAPDSGEPAPDLGYHGDATIVLLSDGEDTTGPDAVAAAELAAAAGVHIESIGVGTVEGATIEVDGFRLATSLDEELLTEVAETTSGSYHRAQDAAALDAAYRSLDLRITTEKKPVELTGAVVGIAVLLLTIGGLLMINWFGRIL
jgi:Ca-activated chloride channel family protein